jgi:hypothetical protein
MAELETIAATLRRQRKDLETMMDDTSSRTTEMTDLFGQIEDLRRRSEETQRRFHASVEESRTKSKK